MKIALTIFFTLSALFIGFCLYFDMTHPLPYETDAGKCEYYGGYFEMRNGVNFQCYKSTERLYER